MNTGLKWVKSDVSTVNPLILDGNKKVTHT